MNAKTRTALTFALLLATQGHAQPASTPTTLYGVTTDGSLKWYRHLAPLTAGGLYDQGSWDYTNGGNEIGTGWNDSVGVFTTGEGVIYDIFSNGDLYWYKHDAYRTGGGLNDPGAWNAASRHKIGNGWNGFKQVFATSGGVIYAISPNGDLHWYKHNAYRTGQGLETPGAWDPQGGKVVGTGWNTFTKVFAAPGGIIYGVMPNGDLRWYHHLAYRTGGGLSDPGAWDAKGGKVVGTGWNGFRQLVAVADGVMYGVKPDGSLHWYRHLGYRSGLGLYDQGSWDDTNGGKEIGTGWNFAQLFGF